MFVPNSTDEGSKKNHLTTKFRVFGEEEEEQEFEPDKNPPKTDRCAVGYYQDRNLVLTATIMSNSETQAKRAVMRYKKSQIKQSLHGHIIATWWTGDRWSSEKQCSLHEEGDYYVAECNHLSDFTFLIDGAQTDPILCDKTLSIFGYAVNGGSILSLLILNFVYSIN